MNLLLDTHTFIGWSAKSTQLSARVLTLLHHRANRLVFSLASIWEMQIKIQSGKLSLPAPLPKIIATQQQTNRLELLPVVLPHVLALEGLPSHHKDPFDRLLIAQAQVENLTLVSHDPMFARYTVPVVW